MAANDNLLDFDLNFFQQSCDQPLIPPKLDKQRKSILIAKKKTIATDSLIRKYYEKRDILNQIERSYLESKEECKQICMQYRNALQKVSILEESEQKLQIENRNLEQRCSLAEDKFLAVQSHINQLEMLLKEQEIKMQALEIDKMLEKNSAKEFEKKLSHSEKEKEGLLNHIYLFRDIALGKKKIDKNVKILLKKYKNPNESHSEPLVNDDETCDVDDTTLWHSDEDCYDDELLKEHCEKEMKMLETKYKLSKNPLEVNIKSSRLAHKQEQEPVKSMEIEEVDRDSDCSNGIISSVDTGRGSSLTFSESEKCFLSPDYDNNDSPPIQETKKGTNDHCDVVVPLHQETNQEVNDNCDIILLPNREIKGVNRHCDILLSECQETNKGVNVNCDTLLPPNQEKNNVVNGHCDNILPPNHKTNKGVNDHCNINSHAVQADVGDIPPSPMFKKDNTSYFEKPLASLHPHDSAFEYTVIIEAESDEQAISDEFISNPTQNIIEPIAFSDVTRLHVDQYDKKINGSNIVHNVNDNSEDYEVSSILNTMSLHYNLITPIPPSPPPTTKECDVSIHSCPEAASLREDNKVLHASMASLAKQVMEIKSLLKTQFMNGVVGSNPIDNHSRSVEVENMVNNIDINVSKNIPCIEAESESDELQNNNDDNSDGTIVQSVVERLQFDEPPFCGDPISLLNTEENTDTSSANTLMDMNSGTDGHITNCDINLNLDDVTNIKNTFKKLCRKPKLTKLEKIKKKLQPKSKIKLIDASLPKRLKSKINAKVQPMRIKKSYKAVCAASINDKLVYEKAVAVVRDLRAKQKSKKEITRFKKSSLLKPKRIQEKQHQNLPENIEEDIEDKITLEDLIGTGKSTSTLLTEYMDDDMSLEGVNKINTETNDSNKILTLDEKSPKSIIKTRSRTRSIGKVSDTSWSTLLDTITESNCSIVKEQRQSLIKPIKSHKLDSSVKVLPLPERGNCLKRHFSDVSSVQNKRILRSSAKQSLENSPLKANQTRDKCKVEKFLVNANNAQQEKPLEISTEHRTSDHNHLTSKDYSDLEMFSDSVNSTSDNSTDDKRVSHPKDSILCRMIEKYAKTSFRKPSNRVPDSVANSISKQLEVHLERIWELKANETKAAMNGLVNEMKRYHYKEFLSGFMKYLKAPERRTELLGKTCTPPAPPMTMSEQILMYVIAQLKISWSRIDIVNEIMRNIEYSIFRLNYTPDFETIESLSHFYSILCRYTKNKNRLRLFMLDAMYCMSFKAIPLIRQCLDVWMHVIPLSHLGIAKTPLVVCLVYLLHFYKCHDHLKRVQDIRFILYKRYSYEMSEWNEKKILEMFKNAILELRDIPAEKKMLRIALILLAKRQGPQWCQKNLIKNIILPFIDRKDVPERIQRFCISLLGPLLKPYPSDMKVHCEIVMNLLFDMLEQNRSQLMEEAVLSALILMNKHSPYRVTEALLTWKPQSIISPDFEGLMCSFVKEKPVRGWTQMLSRHRVV